MTKEQLVEAMAESAEISKTQAEKALHAFTDSIKTSLKKGDPVTLTGFGAFKVSKRAAREGRNPQTGAPVKIPARTVPKFSPGKGLKDAVQ